MIKIRWMKMTVIIPTDVEFIKSRVIQRECQYGVILQMQIKKRGTCSAESEKT